MRRLLADRNARLYITAVLVSSFGDVALYLAIAIWIRTVTGSTSAAGGVFVAFSLGFLLSPITSVWVDRVRRRPLLITLNLATAAVVLVLLACDDRQRLWAVYVITVGYGLATGTMRSARLAILRTIVPDDLIGDAISVIQVIGEILTLSAPLLSAGLLVRFGLTPVIVLDAVTFLITAAVIAAISGEDPKPTAPRRHWIAELTSGIRYVFDTRILRHLIVLATLVGIAGAILEITLFSLVAHGLHRPVAFIAVLATVEGVGAMAAGLATPSLMRGLGRSATLRIGLVTASTGVLLLAFGLVVSVAVGEFLVGSGLALVGACYLTLFQLSTPSELIGRTDSSVLCVLSVTQTLFTAVGAALNSVVDYRLLLLVVVALLLVALAHWSVTQHSSAQAAVAPD
jgi:hypothetical protein